MEAGERENNAKEALGVNTTTEEAAAAVAAAEDKRNEHADDGYRSPPHEEGASSVAGGGCDKEEASIADGRIAAMKRSVERKVAFSVQKTRHNCVVVVVVVFCTVAVRTIFGDTLSFVAAVRTRLDVTLLRGMMT